ncbi:MAG TPA: SpoIID/LytB domain-containing protein [Pyrinomonadaceae bacterium]|nr:SpoIID/LytB domain-containing protein [Pyrinomonadaceae bacterium]
MLIRVLTFVLISAGLLSLAFLRKETATVHDLQTVAETALGDREGAIVIIDPQTGRVRAAVNPELAFERAFSPGSTIKPFTTLTALRAGIIDENSRTRCREKYQHDDYTTVCSHPRDLPPLDPAEAIAYSCNYYFATTGERISSSQFAQTLTNFGFNRITQARWQPYSAIGEGEFVQVTPMQLLLAYTALFNGGRLFDEKSGSTNVSISAAERAILLEGMRGAIKYGTAEKANLDSLHTYVIGKTGTATPLHGFRSQGWFVGLAFAPNKPPDAQNLQLAVVVYLKNSHGSDAAQVAAPLFKTSVKESVPIRVSQTDVNVDGTRLPLEDYVAHVLSVEASTDDQPESLKALATVVRTYALKNLGRHKDQGYDFCHTTHCQRFEPTAPTPAAVNAAQQTTGLTLRDDRNAIAETYFSASCGGMTSNLKTLWGAPAPQYLSGVRDDYCHAGANSHWTDVISSERMLTALRSDPRTDVGETIRELIVSRRDQTGRAELVSITGRQKRVINGWEFKLIVGRALGWNVLKSSRFTISRSGSAFVFHGTGFGHGLGLCQEGAHEMAQRGYNFRQILAKYFPGANVGPQVRMTSRRSSHFTVQSTDGDEVERILKLLESTRSTLVNRLSAAGIEANLPDVEIVINKTAGDFVGRTGVPAWAAAATRNNRIELQPVSLLKQRGILETTLRHELVHVFIDAVGGKQTPRWLAEGFALYIAGEGKLLERFAKGPALSPNDLERKLAAVKSADEMKAAYAAAYKTVRDLVRVEGENKLWQRVAQRSYDVTATAR